MSQLMTIQSFSIKTGIPKSTLRYYESKGLLYPTGKNETGYRLYADGQVKTAKLIASLRLADVPISDIQSYLDAKEIEQEKGDDKKYSDIDLLVLTNKDKTNEDRWELSDFATDINVNYGVALNCLYFNENDWDSGESVNPLFEANVEKDAIEIVL